jgi:hypothetical protein
VKNFRILDDFYIVMESNKLLVRIEAIPFGGAVPKHVYYRKISKESE